MPFINGIGPLELIIVLVIALIVVGPGKLPDVGAALGKSIREFRKAATDVKDATSLDAPATPTTPAAPAAQLTNPAAPAAVAAAPVPAAVEAAPVGVQPAPEAIGAPTAAQPESEPAPVADEQPTPTA